MVNTHFFCSFVYKAPLKVSTETIILQEALIRLFMAFVSER